MPESPEPAPSSTLPRPARLEAHGARGMVTAKHPAVAEIGLRVLREGGNAVDAAATMAFAIGVAEPQMSGLGGGGFMTVQMADGRAAVVDYFARAPGAATPEMYALTPDFRPDRLGFSGVEDQANLIGHRAVAVPGMVSGLALALVRFGTRNLAAAVDPAIALAEEGFAVTWPLTLMQATSLPLLRRFPATAAAYLQDGLPYSPGQESPVLLRQPELAATLRRIATEGPDGFYRGPTARAIAAELERAGGLVSVADLARYEATIGEPLRGDYRGRCLLAIPGAAGGTTLMQAFNMLAHDDMRAFGHNQTAGLHLLIEVLRRCHADRLAYLGDPEQASVPWQGLLSPHYAAQRRASIDPHRHSEALPGEPWRFEGSGAGRAAGAATPGDGGCTTHLAAVDAAGNAVAVTQTLTSLWGSGVTAAGTGVLLNNTMNLFNPSAGNANSIAGWKRPASSMSHFIVLQDGQVALVAGAPGGRRIMDTVFQVLLNVLDFGLGVQEAVAAPLIDTTGPETHAEDRIDSNVIAALRQMGHEVAVKPREIFPINFARPSGILRGADGTLRGGADPYDAGIAMGW